MAKHLRDPGQAAGQPRAQRPDEKHRVTMAAGTLPFDPRVEVRSERPETGR